MSHNNLTKSLSTSSLKAAALQHTIALPISPAASDNTDDAAAEEIAAKLPPPLVPPLPPLELSHSSRCAVFWDYENCPPPSGMPGYLVVDQLRKAIQSIHSGMITQFKAYLQITENEKSQRLRTLRSELQSAGVSLTDTPHNGRKDAADKMILVDLLAFAIDNPPPATVVLISGDRDFVYALSTLRNRRYNTVLIVPNRGASIILRSQANVCLEWRYDVLQYDAIKHLVNPDSPEKHTQTTNVSTPSSARSGVSSVTCASAGSGAGSSGAGKIALSHSSKDLRALDRKDPTSGLTIQTSSSSDNLSNLAVQATVGYSLLDEDPTFLVSPKAPGFFELLVEVLENYRTQGNTRVKRSKLKSELLQRNPLLLQRAGLSSIDDYIDIAVRQKVVVAGGDPKNGWVGLAEDLINKF